MPRQDIVVIGGSAGALEALVNILTALPSRLEAAIFAVLHTAPQGGGALPQVLSRSTALPVDFAVDGSRVEKSRVYVAPPDHHVTLEDGVMSVHRGPRENGFRPAVDPLFRSAASAYNSRVVGVILSGALDDGTFGLLSVKQAGGTAIVQHPNEAFVPSMPLSAIQNVEVDYIVRTPEIASLLIQAAQQGLRATSPVLPMKKPTEAEGGGQRDITQGPKQPDDFAAPPSTFVCPECGGSFWEMKEADLQRFRCHTGHGFTMETLLASQNGKLESALWSAVRVLMERAALHRQLADRTERHGMGMAAQRHRDRAHVEEQNAQSIRDMLAGMALSTQGIEPPLAPAS
jgi:two-component system chemotaxis response regulator CheB